MLITCPYCATSYNLPDEKVNEELKLRCSNCKKVFGYTDVTAPSIRPEVRIGSESDPKNQQGGAPKKSKKRKFFLIFILLLLVLGGVVAALWNFTGFLNPYKAYVNEVLFMSDSEVQQAKMLEQVRLLELQDMRQYTASSEKIGEVAVIEGKISNNFYDARANILVEVTLYDNLNNPLITKTQLAGTVASLFQLQVYGQEELEATLANQETIAEHNSNVIPGGTVPFMVLFYNPPENAASFGVRIVEATIIPNEEVVEEELEQ